MSIYQSKSIRGKLAHRKEKSEYDDLIIAIIKQAADDYRLALRGGSDRKYKPSVEEIESFFRSSFYAMLTDIPGEMIIDKLKQEFLEENNRGKETNTKQGGVQKGTQTN